MAQARGSAEPPQNGAAGLGQAMDADHGTGTGRQIDAFSLGSDSARAAGQFDMFSSRPMLSHFE